MKLNGISHNQGSEMELSSLTPQLACAGRDDKASRVRTPALSLTLSLVREILSRIEMKQRQLG